MPNVKPHPKPCADCHHTEFHGQISGCTAVTSEQGKAPRWCPCEAYVPPQAPTRDRVAGRSAGIALGEQGADAALHGHAMNDGNWRAQAEARMNALIALAEPFTSEDVTEAVGVAPSPSAIGGLFKAYRKSLEPAGFTIATRPEAHGRALRVWKGKAA